MNEPVVSREDVRATIEARRELGLEHEDHLVDAFVERIEARLAERPSATVPAGNRTGGGVAVGIVSILAAIPLVPIAGSAGGGLAVIAVCVFLIAINALYWEQTK